MANITLQQLQSAGFTIVAGAGERIQAWTGRDPSDNVTSVMCVWDSISTRRFFLRGDLSPTYVMRAVAGVAAVLADLIQAVPVSALPQATKTIMLGQLLDAIKDD